MNTKVVRSTWCGWYFYLNPRFVSCSLNYRKNSLFKYSLVQQQWNDKSGVSRFIHCKIDLRLSIKFFAVFQSKFVNNHQLRDPLLGIQNMSNRLKTISWTLLTIRTCAFTLKIESLLESALWWVHQSIFQLACKEGEEWKGAENCWRANK